MAKRKSYESTAEKVETGSDPESHFLIQRNSFIEFGSKFLDYF